MYKLIIFIFLSLVSNISFSGNMVCFSPKGNCELLILNVINNSKIAIDLSIFSFTSKNISNALIEAKNRNIAIRVVMETDQAINSSSKYNKLLENKIPIKLDNKSGYMHNKYLISDNTIVITGSYNYSANAEFNNYENILIIENPELANIYTNNFNEMWEKFR